MNRSIRCKEVNLSETIGSYKKLNVAAIIMTVAGAAGLIAYVVLSTVLGGDGFFDEPPWVSAFLAFAVPFTVGLILVLSIRSLEKMRERLKDSRYMCEFFSDCFVIVESRGDETLSARKELYENIVRAKIKGNYLVTYASDAHMIPAGLEGLSQAEINTLKKLFRLPAEEGAEVVELGECDAEYFKLPR